MYAGQLVTMVERDDAQSRMLVQTIGGSVIKFEPCHKHAPIGSY